MHFLRFIFSFLFIRDSETDEVELSRPRLAIFCGVIFLIMLAITIVNILQTPTVSV